ncbi:MAG TPA: DUF1232 domain-containing protein [Thermodesulfobacteriota bacterium]
MAETVLGRLIRRRGLPWTTLVRWLPKAPRVLRLVWRLVADRRVPAWPKVLAAAVAAYLFAPVDLVPEAIFGPLGVADDLGLVVLALKTLLSSTPAPVLAEHLEAVGLDV